MSNVEIALSRFKKGFNCTQSILFAFGPGLGLDEEAALRLGQGFGAGMGRMGETCGAVTGAYMVIGLKFGSPDVKDREAKEKSYGKVLEFAEKFKEKHGSTVCKEILGCDLSTSEGMEYAVQNNLIEKLCTVFVKDAVEILDELSR